MTRKERRLVIGLEHLENSLIQDFLKKNNIFILNFEII